MFTWLKKIWKDAGVLSYPQFGRKYLLPVIALFLTWGLLGHLYTIQLRKKSLVINPGIVTEIIVKLERGTKRNYIYYPLKISLENYTKEFRLQDHFTKFFGDLERQIQVGDTITLYTRNKMQTFIGMGKQIDIYQIEKSGKILFPLKLMADYQKMQALIFGIFALVVWTLYILYRRKGFTQ